LKEPYAVLPRKTEKGWKGMATKENRLKVKNLTSKIGGERIATDLVQRVSPFTSSHPRSPATVQSLEQGESFFFSSFSLSHPVSPYFSNSGAEL
jgi:hypothetical protein